MVALPPLHAIRHFLLDMDGTLYLGKNLIPGAPGFIEYLRESGRKWLFFTNNSSHNARQYSEKLTGLGIPADPEEILTSGEATIRYLLNETPYRRLFVVGMPSFEEEVRQAGLTITDDKPDAVVLAFDRSLTYEKIEQAGLLLREGTPFIATNPDKVCPTEYGYIPDCAAMAALFEVATGRTPRYIGKPNAEMACMGMQKIGGSPESTAMVGDRLYTDMEMAHRSGIASILVFSGESTPADVESAPRKPSYAFPSVEELTDALKAADEEAAALRR